MTKNQLSRLTRLAREVHELSQALTNNDTAALPVARASDLLRLGEETARSQLADEARRRRIRAL